MKVYKYEPKMIGTPEGEVESSFDGCIEVEIPTYRERLDLVKSMNIDPKNANIDHAVGLIVEVEKRIKSVNLNLKNTNEKITTFEELGYYQQGSAIINEIGRFIISGIPLGNP
jgi:hypothetical protein